MPGLESSQVHVTFNKSRAKSDWCIPSSAASATETLYFFDWRHFMPPAIGCYMRNLRLHYNARTRKTSDTPGVQLSVHGFGHTHTVETIDGAPESVSHLPAFSALVHALVAKHGYERGVSVRAAPYDWRKAPNEMQHFYTKLTKLVEDTYALNGNVRVLLVAHSMGNPLVLVSTRFLLHQTT